MLGTRRLCVLLSTNRLPEAIRQPRRSRARFNTFTLLHSYCVGFPCCLGVEDRPLAHWTNTRPAGRQAEAADPEILPSPRSTWLDIAAGLRTTRFTPAGRDLGEALWSHWRQACAKAKTLLQFLLSESHSDGALTST